MLPETRKGIDSGWSPEEAGTNLSRSRREAAAGSTGDEVIFNLHSYVLRESSFKTEITEIPPAVSSCALDERASDRFRELPFTQ